MSLNILKVSFAFSAVLTLSVLTAASLPAKKITTRVKPQPVVTVPLVEDKTITPDAGEEFYEVTGKLTFSGYDKPSASSKESFFIDNGSENSLSAIELEISYRNREGKEIHRRSVTVEENLPAGEMRRVEIKSWDTQRSFHYAGSKPSKNGSTPYTVRFRVISFTPEDSDPQ